MQSIFGTDGIRGRFNKEITYSLAYKVGYALGLNLENNNPILIGRDTRISGDILLQAISKGFEPLLLLPIGFGAILTNIPVAEIAAQPIPGQPGGFLYYFYTIGVQSGVFPLLIFMGVGAMTDFGP